MHLLQQVRRGGFQRLAHRDPAGGPEGQLRAVDAVIAAVDQRHCYVDHGKAQRSLLHRIPDALLDGGNILPGHRSAMDALVELEAFAATQRLPLDDNIAELTLAAGLLLVPPALGAALANHFLLADRRLL